MYYYLVNAGYLVDQRRESARKMSWDEVQALVDMEASVNCWVSINRVDDPKKENFILEEVAAFQEYMSDIGDSF